MEEKGCGFVVRCRVDGLKEERESYDESWFKEMCTRFLGNKIELVTVFNVSFFSCAIRVVYVLEISKVEAVFVEKLIGKDGLII